MTKRCICVALGLVACSATPAYAEKLYLSSGIEFSTGDYGEPEKTDSLYGFAGAKYVDGPWAFRATLPILWSSGPAAVAPDDGDVTGTDPDADSTFGLGDFSLGLVRSFTLSEDDLFLDLNARVRVPTGDADRGLGSGSVDGSLTANVAKAWGSVETFFEVGRRFNGDWNGFHRRDGWTASAGMSYTASGSVEIGASLDWREATVDFAEDPLELSGYVAFPIADGVRMNGFGSIGISGDASDFSAGISISWRVF